MIRRLSSVPARLSIFYAAFFCITGVQQPFWPLWLAYKGLGPTEIGVIFAISIGIKVLSTPTVAHWADRSGERWRLMCLLTLLSLVSFALFGFTDSIVGILLVSLLFYGFWPPVMSLCETLTVRASREMGFDYGRVRLWGSLSFIIVAVAAGHILDHRPASAVYWMVLAGTACTALVCLVLVPDLRTQARTSKKMPLLEALADRRFVICLVACGLIQGSHAVYYAFGAIHWKAAGYSETIIGLLWAEGVVAEILLFAFGAPIVRRLGPGGLIAVAGIAAGLRFVVTGSTVNLAALAAVQVLHAASFGAAHLGAMHYIGRFVSPALSATAQSLYSGIVWGLFLGSLLFAAGELYARYGGQAFHAMAIIGLIGGALGWWLSRFPPNLAPVSSAPSA